MKDYVIRATGANGQIRAFVGITTNMVEEARRLHETSKVATAALGRTLTATSMMGLMMKNKGDKLSVIIKGGGPIGTILTTSDVNGTVKGYVSNPKVEVPDYENGKLNVAAAVGTNGVVKVIKDLGLREPYNGAYPLVSGEIAEDFTKYFADSEQKPTAIALGVLVNKDGTKSSGGYRLNLMPDATEDIITKLEENINKAGSISSMLSENLSLEDIAKKVTGDNNLVIVENNIEPQYECDCSKEKFEKGLISLGKRELENIIKEDDKIETVCQFCNKKYVFNKNILKNY